MTRACQTCEWFVNDDRAPGTGQCRGAPPSVVTAGDDFRDVWPRVTPQDWCGAYRISEAIIVGAPVKDAAP